MLDVLRKIVIATEADDEINTAYFRYEGEQTGLGERFLAALRRSIYSAASQPDFYPIRFDTFRRIKVSKFPYVIYFEHDDEHLKVQSVFHESRNPSDLDRLRSS